jgi:hypothetical protein
MTSLPSCTTSQAPDIQEVYDRLVELIDQSVEVNVILFGAGLPVYERDSREDELIHRYYSLGDESVLMVSDYARYTSLEQMQAAIREVYSPTYADSLIETLFTGYVAGDGSVVAASYSEGTYGLLQSVSYQPLVSGVRIFNYSTMTILPTSTATYLHVSVSSRQDTPDSQWTTTSLSFALEDGTWYLDGPSC